MNLRLNLAFLRAPAILAGVLAVLMLGLTPAVGRAQDSAPAGQASDPEDDDPKDKDGEESQQEGDEKAKDGRRKLKIDPELQRRIDELLESQGVQPAPEGKKEPGARTGSGRKRMTPEGKQPSTPTKRSAPSPSEAKRIPAPSAVGAQSGEPSGAVTTLDIPPMDSDVPPEERKYIFSIKDGTYEQLVEGFARQTGLGVTGESPKDGKVTFVSTEELTFKQAMGRVRMLLFRYKPHDPYWIIRHETHLEVTRVTDFYRILPRERMFKMLEEFRTAGLPDDELALVVYTPKSGSVADLKVVRDFLPDYVRVTPLEDKNSVTIFALVKDIEKYLGLIDFFAMGSRDPRTLERIEIQYISPTEAVNRLQELMNFDGTTRGRSPVRRGKDASPLDILREPGVTLLPDDAQGVLIVRAMQDKIEEIKELLPYIDVDTSLGEVRPVIIPVEHAGPEGLVNTIRQILAAYAPSPQVGATVKKRPTRARKPSGRAPAMPVSADSVTMLVHPSESAIIVIGRDEDVQEIRNLVAKFDVPASAGPIRIPLEYADAVEINTTLTLLLGSSGRGKAAVESFAIVPDPGNDAIWFTGSERDLKRVRELVSTLDVPDQIVSLHVIRLRNHPPSFVARMLQEFERGGAGPARPAAAKGKSSRKRSPKAATSKFTPDDEHKRLFVLCTDTEWDEYVSLIKQLEDSIDETPPFIRVPLEHMDADAAIDRLTVLLGGAGGRAADVRYAPADDGLFVIGATEEQLEDIRIVLAEIDQPVEIERRFFDIVHRDAGEIKTTIEALVGGGGDGKAPRRRPARKGAKGATPAASPALPELMIVQLDNRLIVDTTPERMEQVAELIAEFDVPEATTELKIYDDFPPNTDIEATSETLSLVLTGRSATAKRGRKPPPSSGTGEPRFIAQPNLGKLLVIADPAMFPEIEQVLEVLHTEVERAPIEVVFIDVEYADPVELVEQVTPLLDIKVRELIADGELSPSTEEVGAAAKPSKRKPQPSGDASQHYHLAPDIPNNRIVVAAPQAVVEQAQALILQFDIPHDDTEVLVKTVQLNHADSAEMVRAVREMIGAPARAAVTRKGGKRRGQATDTRVSVPLTVVEAPGGGAVILRGLAEEIEEATGWIEQFDMMSTHGRMIKVYEIEHADIRTLGNLIMNVVDRPAGRPAAGKKPRARRGTAVVEEESDFDLTKTWTGQEVYIQADLIAGTMIVAASESKMTQIDGIIAQFDAEGEGFDPAPAIPSFMYELQYVDAMDAEFDLQMVLEQLWYPPDDLPQIEAAFWGDFLIIKYPHEDRFAEIEELIREHVDKRPGDWFEKKQWGFTPPPGTRPSDIAAWFKLNHPELDIEIVDVSKLQDTTFGLEQVKPSAQPEANPCVLPLAFARMVDGLVGSVTGQTEPEDNPPPEDDEAAIPPDDEELLEEEGDEELFEDEEVVPPSYSDNLINAAVQSMFQAGTAVQTAEPPVMVSRLRPSGESEKLKIYIDNDTGAVIMEGRAGILDEIPDWITEYKKEIEDLQLPPDIRIVRVRYIDVNSAAQILEEMFNATRQQRAAVAAAQRRQQQAAARQAQQQRRQQQQQQQQEGQEGQQGQSQRTQRRGQQQQQAAVPQLPPTAVRVYPNPRDRTLILRADTNQYPAIFELLATIDQPRPIDSELRIFKLEKLNAVEVEAFLNDMLGLGQSSQTTRTAPAVAGRQRQGRTARRAAPAGGGLPQTIMQETITGSMLGVDAENIKLSSNEEANTIIAMAPSEALDFIGDLIKQLESGNVPERLTKYYELTHAAVDEVAEYLTTHFAEAEGTGGGGAGKRRGGASSGRSLNTPTFVPYPRLNLLTVLATEEQIEEIDSLIERLDVTSEQDQWEYVTLEHCDAGTMADTLSQMFGGATAGAGRGRARGAAPSGASVQFIGDAGGRMLLYSAPEGLREQILDTIAKLEAEAQERSTLRIIELQYATPVKVTEAIEAAYGGGGSGGRGGGRSGRSTGGGRSGRSTGGARFTITPDDASKRLFVFADEAMFAEIESLAKTLDRPAEIGFEFRIYPLEYANAREVHTVMTKLLTDYIRQLSRGGADREAFSVEVNDRTNSLIVLGSETIFNFVQESLAKVDNPANAASPPGFMMVALENAVASEVAQNIMRLWNKNTLPPGQEPPQVEANRTLNTLIIRGTQEQIDEIKREVIEPLEAQAAAALLAETIRLQYADPEVVAESINRIFEDKKRAMQSVRQGGSASPLDFTVIVTPDVNTREVIVQASETNMALVKARIAELDREEIVASGTPAMKIYTTKYTDATAVAGIINSWARSRRPATGGGGTRDNVEATAEQTTQSVVVMASETNHLIVAELIAGLDVESSLTKGFHRYELKNAEAEELAQVLRQAYQSKRPMRRGEQPVEITADPATNMLLITATQAEMADLRLLIESLDVEPNAEWERQIRTIDLTHADLWSVQDAINKVFKTGGRNTRDQVTAVPDFGSNSVIVSASLQNMKRVEKLIAQVDTETGQQQEVHVINIETTDAEAVAQTLTEIFIRSAPRPQGGQPPPISISALRGSKAILVKCRPEDFADIQTAVADLDREGAVLGEVVRVVPLLFSDVTEMQTAMRDYLKKPGGRGGRGDELVGDMRISVLTQSNALVISGNKEDVDRLEATIGELDKAGEKGAVPQIIRLKYASVGQVLPNLQEMFSDQRGGRGQQPPVILANEAGNFLIVKASAVDLSSIELVIAQLDTEEAAQDKNIRIVQVGTGLNVIDLAEMVEESINESAQAQAGRGQDVQRIRVTPDTRSGSMILAGASTLFDQAEEMIHALEGMGPRGAQGLKIIRLGNVDADEIQQLIEQLKGEQSSRKSRSTRGGSSRPRGRGK